MKLFKFPEENYKEIIDELIKRYRIDGSSVYATLDSINNVIQVDSNMQNNKIQNNNIQNNNNEIINNDKHNNKINKIEGNEDKNINQKNENLE